MKPLETYNLVDALNLRGSGGIFEGSEANLEKYIKYHQAAGSSARTVRLPTTPEQERAIKARADNIGDPRGFSCASSVSGALDGTCGIEGSSFPGSLNRQAEKAQCQ